MPYTVCAFVPQAAVELTKQILIPKLAGKAQNIIVSASPADFTAAKSAGPIALFIQGPASHAVLKDLCDDYDQGGDRRVKFVYSFTAGVDAYNLKDLRNEIAGIPIHNAQGLYSRVLAEHVVFSMLYFNRSPWRLNKAKHEKKWDRFNMTEVHGQKVAVMGYGSIGQHCGKLAAGLGMHVTGIRRSAPSKPVDEHGVHVKTEAETDAVVAEADFVVGVLPGTPATKHFFNKAFFAKMKPNAVFINIGRGVTHCEADVVEALQKGTIRAAALDVFEEEPLPESSPLWELPDDKLLLSAHCADFTDRLVLSTVENFANIFENYHTTGTSDAYRVDIDRGY